MAYQPETATYDVGVPELETTTPVQGGPGGASNAPLLALADRTAYLKQHVDNLESGATVPPGIAVLNSPAFTGTPTAPTPALGDRSGKVSTTQFVQDTVYSITNKNVAGGANVVLTAAEAGVGTLAFSGALTANISVIVPNTAKRWIVVNSTTGAFTLTVKTAAGIGIAVTQGRATDLACDSVNVFDPKTDFPSPVFTGDPQAPTAPQFDNDVSVATTAFVKRALGNFGAYKQCMAATTLAASDMGSFVWAAGAATYAITLPVLGTMPDGTVLQVWSSNPAGVTVNRASTDNILVNSSGVQSIRLAAGDSLYLVAVPAAGVWIAFGGTAQLASSNNFAGSVAASGWQKIPGGLILQWGVNTLSPSSSLAVTLPVAFPNAGFIALASGFGASFASAGQPWFGALVSQTQITLQNMYTASNASIAWLAIGW